MTKRSKTKRSPWYMLVGVFISILSIALVLTMIIPVWVPLTVGLASLSIVLFSISTIIASGLFLLAKTRRIRQTALLAVTVSLFAIVVPQIAFFNAAKKSGVTLSFDPVSYMTFSGSPSIQPTFIKTYKTVSTGQIAMSYYKPEKVGKRPVIVLLHGGAWRYGNHLETGLWPDTLTKAGYAVVSPEYRLSNDSYHSWEDAPADVHDAIMYLKANSEFFSIDPEQIHIMGQSAGGHLALLEAYRFESVRSVTALYAPIDLTLDYATSRDKSAELDFIGGPPKQYRERYESLSPVTYVDHQEPRTLIIQGMYDDLVHPSQATRLQDVLNTNNVQNELLLLPLTGHSFENQRGGFATQITTQRVLRFLK